MNSTNSLACIFIGGVICFACGSQPTGSPVEGQNAPAVTTDGVSPKAVGEILATLSTDDGHTFVFGRSVLGDLVVAERAPIGERAVLEGDVSRGEMTDVYSALSGGQEAPAVLKAAVATAAAARAAAAESKVVEAPTTAPPKGSIIKVDSSVPLTSNQQWFQSTICSLGNIQVCDLGSGSQNTQLYQWEYAPNFYAYGLNDSSNTSAGTLNEFVWNGSAWVADWSSSAINPGDYWYENWWNSAPKYRAAEMVDSGPGALGEGGVTPSCSAVWGNTQMGDLGGEFSYQDWGFSTSGFQFDINAETSVNIGGVKYTCPAGPASNGVAHGAITVVDSTCPDDAVYNSNPFTVTFTGKTTGQTCTTTVSAPFFAPANCCASRGGGNHDC